MEVIRPTNVNLTNITYSEQRPFGEHAKIVYINHNNKPIIIQTPVMTTPYGLGKFEEGTRVKYSIDMSFRGADENPKIKELYDVLSKLDDKIITDSTKRGQEWFKKKNRSKDLSKELFVPSIKIATENGEPTDKYPPTFKAKVPFYDDKFNIPTFDMTTKSLMDSPLDEILTKGSTIQGIVKLNGIWFAGGKFGVSWEIKQLKVKPTEKLLSYAFVESDDEDATDVNDDNEAVDNNEYVMESEEEDL